MIAVGVGVHHHIDVRCHRNRPAHRIQHFLGELQIEEGIDEQRCSAIGDEASVAPAPRTVWLQVGIDGITEIVQSLRVLPGSHMILLYFATYAVAGVRFSGIQPVGAGVPTRLRSTPIPSTSSSITSPGLSSLPSSRPQPKPTVPDPINSPAW